MAAGSTYTPIVSTTTSSAARSFNFTSIPSTYTDLVLVVSLTTAAPTNMRMRFNSNVATNYSTTHIDGSGTAATSARENTENGGLIDYAGGYPNGGSSSISTYVIQINNYSNATTFKTWINRASNSGTGANATVGLWRQTSAINAIEIYTSSGSGTISSGTVFTLYGIAAA
jgi:hypothetical protein